MKSVALSAVKGPRWLIWSVIGGAGVLVVAGTITAWQISENNRQVAIDAEMRKAEAQAFEEELARNRAASKARLEAQQKATREAYAKAQESQKWESPPPSAATPQPIRSGITYEYCVAAIKQQLREPRSFEEISHQKEASGVVYLKFRARNGYGGMTVDTALCALNGDVVFADQLRRMGSE